VSGHNDFEFVNVDGFWYRTGGLQLKKGDRVRVTLRGEERTGTVYARSNVHPWIPPDRILTVIGR